ncbi:Ku protein [Paraconexibacter sp.]|uniref:non-homologous end joining protein Ku n=1 Tax=Paraconexibacter sp. TaxID=2949640 RepID=UPI0035680657
MPRAIWSGAISFGLVTVPVKMYPAVRPKSVRFNQLDGADNARIKQKRVNDSTGEEVPYDRIVKGYEISPDRYVVIEPAELEAIQPKKTRTIEIEDFVDLAEIDPVHFDTPYYLAPATGGAKPYRLLLDAMNDTGKVAIARVVLRTKEALVAIRPMAGGEVLGCSTMVFADEIVDADGLEEVPAAEEISTTKRELDVAKQLIGSLEADWEPGRYKDSYREEVLSLIEAKASGEEISVAPASEEPTEEVPDLMAALKASLDAVRGDGTPSRSAPERAKTSKAAPGKTPGGSRGPAKAPAGSKSRTKKPAARKAAAKKSA